MPSAAASGRVHLGRIGEGHTGAGGICVLQPLYPGKGFEVSGRAGILDCGGPAGGYVPAYGARRNDNTDDVLWFEQEKVGFDYKMLWFESVFGAEYELNNDVF